MAGAAVPTSTAPLSDCNSDTGSTERTNYVCGTDGGRAGIDVFSFGSAYLGKSTHPFMVGGDPSLPDFQVKNLTLQPELTDRLDDRMKLLNRLDAWRRVAGDGATDAVDEFNRRAVELDTDSARIHRNAGVLDDLYLGQAASALAHFERALATGGDEKLLGGWIAELRQRLGTAPKPASAEAP